MSDGFDNHEDLNIGDPAAVFNREREEELQYLDTEPVGVKKKQGHGKGKKRRKSGARKQDSSPDKKNKEPDEPINDAPLGDWSEFESAKVTDTELTVSSQDDVSPVNVSGLRPTGSNIFDAYTVVEKAEFEKIDITREEARGTIPYKELRDMCAQFASISQAGVSTVDTIRILIEQTPNEDLHDALERIYNEIKDGTDLSVAMGNCACFPFAFTIAVSAAERNDMVAHTFKKFSDIFAREEEQKEMGSISVFYPALVTICSLIVMIVMMLVVYPGFVDMFSGLNTELPGVSRALLILADSFRGIWWLLTIIVALILLAIFLYRKASSADILGPTLGEKSLPAGSYKRMNIYAKFARYMNVLLEVGVAAKDALFVTAHSFTEYPFLTARLLEAANASAEGSTLSNALCVFEFFPMYVLQMISVGEEMGDTPRMLLQVAEYYEKEADRDAARHVARKEPVSIIIMAVVVLFLLLSMLQPVLRFYELVKEL
ncbi:MAG: type II secretion system F family protein [Lachnospiraceae bacterium]|nr:type II secretion system F family protein [Lachnospiraceae bacterium]